MSAGSPTRAPGSLSRVPSSPLPPTPSRSTLEETSFFTEQVDELLDEESYGLLQRPPW
jgi:hypothetical protein